jgi:hypothetical protein
MAAPPRSKLDAHQVLPFAFDEARGKLRVDAEIMPPTGTEVIINHEDDSIRLGDGVDLVGTTTEGGNVGLNVHVLNNEASAIAATPNTSVVAMAVANTEYSFSIPIGTKKLEIKSRESGKLRFSFVTGNINSGNYVTISPGSTRDIEGFLISSATTLYITSSKAADTLEIMHWS